MIISGFLERIRIKNITAPQWFGSPVSFLQGVDQSDTDTTATVESSQRIHVAYRCINILSDDIASMPMQTFEKVGQRMAPNGMQRNISWLLEYEPNRWMNPFIFKKTVTKWLINYGQSYIWSPPGRAGRQNELIILPTNRTAQMIDEEGNIWYRVSWEKWEPLFDPEKNHAYYPDIEVVKLLINSEDGITGRSVLEFARDTMSRQLGASETQGKLYKQGLNPGGLLWMAGELNKEARKKVRESYEEEMSGSGNAYRLAIMDPKATKFEQITMKPIDAQFLESIQATDVEIANFYGIPLYKLNLGKQSYESNAQLDLDYMKTTLNSYLVQWESEGRRKWLSLDQQSRGFYFKFNRDIILATDANTRATYLEKKIQSGQLTPNEGREIDDLPPYAGGDSHYMPANFGMVNADGSIQAGSAIAKTVNELEKFRDDTDINIKNIFDKFQEEKQPPPEPVQVHFHPQVNVPASEVNVTNDVHPAEPAQININVPVPEVTITNEAQPAEPVQVNITVPVPEVNITNDVQPADVLVTNEINIPEQEPATFTVKRDGQGRISGITEDE